MNVLAWNCRGLGLDSIVGELRDLIRSYNPAVVFLCETKKKQRGLWRNLSGDWDLGVEWLLTAMEGVEG